MTEINVGERLKKDFPWFIAIASVSISVALVRAQGFGYDSHAYWSAVRSESLYSGGPDTPNAFLYSPVFAQLLWPLAQVPWEFFMCIWMALTGVTFAYLLAPLGWRLAVPLWLCCTPELVSGNVAWLFALVIAVGLKYPGAWTVPFLTKITPAVGLIWFLMRREWKSLGVSILAVVVIVGVSFAFDPQLWFDWFEFLRTHLGASTSQLGGWSPPPLVRIPAAILLVMWGAPRNKYWVLPAGMALAMPVFVIYAFIVFAGLPRLLQSERDRT